MTDVVVADDSPLLREGLAAVLTQEGAIVVATVDGAAALRAAIAATRPDVALVGIPIPAEEGLSAIELMRLQHPGVGVLVLSSYVDPALALGLIARRPPSTGYLLKQPIPEIATLVRAIGVVAGGGTFVDRSLIERLRGARSRPQPLACLSEREREILTLMAEGRTNSAICTALCLSAKTVESHVRAIFNKLELRAAPADHRRVLAVLRYVQAGKSGTPARPWALSGSDRPQGPAAYSASAGQHAA